MATFQLYWLRKTSGALLCIISGTNGHLSRTTNVPKRLLTSNHLPLTAVGSNPDRDYGFFHVRKLSV
jgi:hypothetical protein